MTKRQLTWFYKGVGWYGDEHTKIDDANCWKWKRSLTYDGYAKFGNRGAHRVAYEHFIGPVPDGLQLDHLCRNRSCVNPWHLEPVTVGENLRRGHAARGTLGGRTGARQRAAQERYRARKRAERGPAKPPWESLKTHCPAGHAYDDENTYVLPSRPTARYCRACKRERDRAKRTANAAA